MFRKIKVGMKIYLPFYQKPGFTYISLFMLLDDPDVNWGRSTTTNQSQLTIFQT